VTDDLVRGVTRRVSPALLAEIDAFLDHLKSASGAVARAARLGNAGGMRLAAIAR